DRYSRAGRPLGCEWFQLESAKVQDAIPDVDAGGVVLLERRCREDGHGTKRLDERGDLLSPLKRPKGIRPACARRSRALLEERYDCGLNLRLGCRHVDTPLGVVMEVLAGFRAVRPRVYLVAGEAEAARQEVVRLETDQRTVVDPENAPRIRCEDSREALAHPLLLRAVCTPHFGRGGLVRAFSLGRFRIGK